jgi:N-methylhydantoinase A
VEWVNLRVSGIGPIRRPQPPRPPARDDGPESAGAGPAGAGRACTGWRPVYFDSWLDTPIYQRSALAPGDEFTGPAIVEEFGATVPVHPGFTARVDTYANLILTRTEVRH